MLRRYELTDDEWNRIADLVPPENTGKQGRPRKSNRVILNGIIWIARSGAPWRDLPERVLSLDAELEELSLDGSIVQAHQHSAGAKKGGLQTKLATAGAEPVPKSMQ